MLRRVLHPRSVVTENNLPEPGAEERRAKTGWVGEAEMADTPHSVWVFGIYCTHLFYLRYSKNMDGFRMKDTLHMEQYSALQILTTALIKSV